MCCPPAAKHDASPISGQSVYSSPFFTRSSVYVHGFVSEVAFATDHDSAIPVVA